MSNDLKLDDNEQLTEVTENLIIKSEFPHIEESLITCKNCGHICHDSFCPICGQKTSVKRLTFKILTSNIIESWFNADRGIFRTIIELFSNPSGMISDYIAGKRIRYFAPFPLMFITATFYALIEKINKTDSLEKIVNVEGSSSFNIINYAYDLIRDNQAISALLSIPIYVLSLRLAFGKKFRKKYNWTECIYATAYYNAQVFIISIITLGASMLYPSAEDAIDFALICMMIVFVAWDMKFNNLPFKKNLFKGLCAFVLVILCYAFILIIAVAIIITIVYVFSIDISF